MRMTLRWYGDDDQVSLEYIRQIPGVTGIVSSLHGIPVGAIWPKGEIRHLKNKAEQHGLSLDVTESVPIHEDIKQGLPSRKTYIDNYKQTLKNLSHEGVKIVCYNFMPLFDWMRTELSYKLKDGSVALAYDQEEMKKIKLQLHDFNLPAWDMSYQKEELIQLLDSYRRVSEEDLWNNIHYFLKGIIPVAEEVGINMAIHPDDPPWSIFGLPRIITNMPNLKRFLNLVDSPNNGLTLCTGSLGAHSENDIPEMIRSFGGQDRIHFAHIRNIKRIGYKSFYESSHRSADGDLDMVEIVKSLYNTGFEGPVRPDHGRMIWGETGRAAYGLNDRALGAAYLNGILEALEKRD